MKILLKIFILIFLVNSLTSISYANQNLKFINLDLLVQNTNIGKTMLEKIKQIDQSNIEKLKLYENELKKIESEMKIKKNIISETEFKKELQAYKTKIDDYNKEKNLMVKNLNDFKNKELKSFFKKINPVIESYMEKNSIEIIFNSKNIFIGNKKSDLTLKLVEEINSKI